MVKRTRKKIVLLLINLRGLIMWSIGAKSPWVKKCVSFSFPPLIYGYAHSVLQRSLNSSSISLIQILCVLKISLTQLFKGKTKYRGWRGNIFGFKILKCNLLQLSILKLDFHFSHGTLCALASFSVRI